MKIKSVITKLSRAGALVVFALLLFVTGAFIMLYSPWAQDLVRQAIVGKMDGRDGRMRVSLSSFSLKFPLTLELSGFSARQGADTMIAASAVRAELALLPLLEGRLKADRLMLRKAVYRQGSPDSVMYMTVHADSIGISPLSVTLADMAIDLDGGTVRGGRFGLFMKPDTSVPTPPAPPSKMSVNVGRVNLEDFTYTMRMMPTIDTLSASMAAAVIDSASIDMYTQTVGIRSFGGHGLDARYIVPDSASIAASGPYPVAVETPDSVETATPWTVKIGSIAFDRSHALYTTAGLSPLPGLDFGYIEVGDLDLHIHNFYNRATEVQLPLSLRGTERCGVELAVDGELDIDAAGLSFKEVKLSTPERTIAAFDGYMGTGDLAADPSLPLSLKLDGAFSPQDLQKMFPDFRTYLAAIPQAEDIQLTADIDGTTGHLDVDRLYLGLNRCVNLDARGYIDNCMVPDRLGGSLILKGNIINVNGFKDSFLEPATARILTIPPMTLAGKATMKNGQVDGRLAARTGSGKLTFDGRWNGRREDYTASAVVSDFPVSAFMPSLGVGDVSASFSADGHGYDPFAKSTAIHAELNLTSAQYQKVLYKDVRAKCDLADGRAVLTAESENPDVEFNLQAEGNLDGNVYNWTASLDGSNINLFALGLSEQSASLEVRAKAHAAIGPGKNDINGHMTLADLYFTRQEGTIGVTDVDLNFESNDSLVEVFLQNRDMLSQFHSDTALDSLLNRLTAASEILSGQFSEYKLDINTLQNALPPFTFRLIGGSDNAVNDILAPSKMSVNSFRMEAVNDSTLRLDGYARRFDTGSMLLDSIYLSGNQVEKDLELRAGLENRPGNLDQWHKVSLGAVLSGEKAHLGIHQENIEGRTGYELGMYAAMSPVDSLLTVNVRPYQPVIGYQLWSVNEDNYIRYHFPDRHLDANLHMKGWNSSLAIFTDEQEHTDSIGHAHQEDLVVRLTDIHIQDWISFNPFAPPVKGDVGADLRLNFSDGILTGNGSAGITGLVYGREKVADFKANFNIAATPTGKINAKADLFVDGKQTMTVSGALNDSTATAPLDLDFAMIHFPLATVNPFLPPGTGRLRGTLNGRMKISGTDRHPTFNGSIDFDSTAVSLALTGTDYSFSEAPIDVADNVVRFDRFAISGCNDNPLYVDGTVDITDLAAMNAAMKLALKADNMMIVNSNRLRKGADVFGKAYISLDASVNGTLNFLKVNADLDLLPSTNVTYVTPGATSAIQNRSTDNMVRFVNFADSLSVARADTLVRSGMAMLLDATLNIRDGSVINVYLSADGQNRAQIQGNGTLTYVMTPLDNGRLSGRFNIPSGYVRYTPPFMSEKNFAFNSGSYVSFTGDMMNPTINLSATDVIKANVTEEGQNSRLINFDVGLSVTGTLENMDVKFDLSTNDDITVANELESMSPEQRANQAMNMLLYNIYTGPGTKGNASLSGNPLFSFLESRINSWAANNIKGVDISFGIDQYDRTLDGNTTSTMSYSYQVSKSLFNDRFKIVVGGNYSTDANADENFSQNLINDISFEYFLNRQKTMYVRIFRHTGYESILEGEITQTGVGFAYRRKIARLGDMFLPTKWVKKREEAKSSKIEKQQ